MSECFEFNLIRAADAVNPTGLEPSVRSEYIDLLVNMFRKLAFAARVSRKTVYAVSDEESDL